MLLTRVVLPTPGPPVSIATLLPIATCDRPRCESDSAEAALLLDPGNGLVDVDRAPGWAATEQPLDLRGTPSSARCSGRQEQRIAPVDRFGCKRSPAISSAIASR